MDCPYCKEKDIENDANYCTNCGEKLEESLNKIKEIETKQSNDFFMIGSIVVFLICLYLLITKTFEEYETPINIIMLLSFGYLFFKYLDRLYLFTDDAKLKHFQKLAEESNKSSYSKSDYTTIGGWLILVGIGVVFSPFMVLNQLTTYKDLLNPDVWSLLTTPGTQYYIKNYSFLVFFEVFFNVLIFLTWCYLNYLFFTKKKLFRNLYLGILIFTPLFLIADSYLYYFMVETEKIFESTDIKEIIKSVIILGIWGSYIVFSERAKKTFIN